eukprot:maker-scaffold327_size205035-snap-gene-0.10 protein:Tk05410 transcript:maker-scaffold327_size205035-snap-gene-0.10-mRNA-1 annotation:"hypothetical protein "
MFDSLVVSKASWEPQRIVESIPSTQVCSVMCLKNEDCYEYSWDKLLKICKLGRKFGDFTPAVEGPETEVIYFKKP